jgi:hypothetical protein
VKAMATVVKDAGKNRFSRKPNTLKALDKGACNVLDGVNQGQWALSGLLIAFPALALAVFEQVINLFRSQRQMK